MFAALLALALVASPSPPPAEDLVRRVAQVVDRLEALEEAARRLDEAEVAMATARTTEEKRTAHRAWLDARFALRAATRRPRR